MVREKKRFENTLDDSVAGGLNAGTDVLMNQVEHIIITKTKPREYYPPDDQAIDLGPTEGCTEAIKCLQLHCNLVKGSTSKEVLEVFYQEIGIRLIAYVVNCLCVAHYSLETQHFTKTHQEADHLAHWRVPSDSGFKRVSRFHRRIEGTAFSDVVVTI